MLLTNRLYDEVAEIWDGYLQHPFIRGMADGSLPVEKFRYYMIQDYLYLLEYVKVFALGVVKAKDEDVMRYYAQLVYSTLDGEMNVHKVYMERLGITEEELRSASLSEVNRSYTSYMLMVAHEGSLLELTVAVLACAWSYEIIGKSLAAVPGAVSDNIYGEWIEGYSSTEYEEGNRKLLALVNRLGSDITEKQFRELKEVFVRCSNYEREFWNMVNK